MTDYPEDIMKAAREAAHGCVERPYNKGTLAKAESRIAAALLAERKAKVKVKPLEWVGGAAACLYGAYSVHKRADSLWECRLLSERFIGSPHDSEKDAKTAAQADYERRIISAIMGGSDE